ncbi:transcription factor [Pseudogymnoascus australis]
MIEDPLTTSVNDAFNMLDPELDPELHSFSYSDAYLNFINPFYLSGVEPSCLDDVSHSSNGALDFPKPHEDLSPFSSQMPETRYTALKSQVPHSGYSTTTCDRALVSKTQDNWVHPINKAASAPLSIITSGLEAADFRTVIHHGQVTPGDSPEEGLSSPHKSVASATARRQPRKEKMIATATATVAASASSAMSKESSTGSQGGSETKVKKQRKPRRSSKKRTTAEQASAKRETPLKRNREVAYKCRLKKKTQTEEVIERVKVLGEDNAAKVVEVERLRVL